MVMKCEDKVADTIEASAQVLKAFRECQSADSDGGELITNNEFTETIFPAIRHLIDEAWKLYVSSLEEHSKEAEVLMHKCMTCNKYNENVCRLFIEMGSHVAWDDFQMFVTKQNSLCIEGADNTFYMPDGEKNDF